MGREEEHNVITLLFWEFLESNLDILGDSLVWRPKDISGHTRGKRRCSPQRIQDVYPNDQ
jgi:hypothetical protein